MRFWLLHYFWFSNVLDILLLLLYLDVEKYCIGRKWFSEKIMYKKVKEKEKLFYCKYLILNSIQNVIIWLNKFQYHTAKAGIKLDHYKQISSGGLELLSAHGDSAMAGPSPWRSMGFVPSYSGRFNNYSFHTTLNTWAIRNKNNKVAQLAVSLKRFEER